jgi:serine/threonine protein kinase
MGAVYLAEDTELHRQVALKIPNIAQEEDDPEMLERFYREARAAATLNHTNICQVYDIGEHEGTRYITMAYVSGPALSGLVGSQKLRSERTIAKLVRKIALGLAEAHGKGILHRDLKPGNILLNERNEPVITDFGLARHVDQRAEERITNEGMLLGTPAYMSPEQVGVDARDSAGPRSPHSAHPACHRRCRCRFLLRRRAGHRPPREDARGDAGGRGQRTGRHRSSPG